MSAFVRRATGVAAAAAAIVIGVTARADAASSHHAGREYFLITVANNQEGVVAHGAFVGAGRDVDHEQSDSLYLSGGKIEIYHPDSQSNFSYTLNPKTCFISFTITGKYTLGAGTGRFAGITGHGTYLVKEQGVARRDKSGACSTDVEPKGLVGYIRGSGPVYRS